MITRQMRREVAQLETLKRYWNKPIHGEPVHPGSRAAIPTAGGRAAGRRLRLG
jgi:hypothetical protein